jgi:hypothetical protein
MEAIYSYETSVDYQRIKQHFIPEIVDWIRLILDEDNDGLL